MAWDLNLYLGMQTILLGEFIVCLKLRIVAGLELDCCYIDLSDVDVVQHNNTLLTTTAPPALYNFNINHSNFFN